MKNLINFVLVLSIFLTACNSNPNSNSSGLSQTNDSKFDLPKTFFKKLKGVIDNNLSITMDLTKIDTTFNGSYYYNNVGLPLSINGHISNSGEIKLIERNAKYEETGKFVGKFTSNESFEGIWTSTLTKKSLTFKLTESKEGVANISFENFHKENCATRDKNKNKPVDESNWTDTLCSYIDISLIKVSVGNPKVDDLINNSIINNICSWEGGKKKYNSINDYLNTINSLNDNELRQIDCNVNIELNSNNILCVRIMISEYGGGAHGISVGSYYNYDLNTGKLIELKDILVANYTTKLNILGEKIFTDANGREGWDFEPGKFKLNDNFSITNSGLNFMFNQYEIGCYAMGGRDLLIPYTDIEDLIKTDGLITRLRQK